MTEYTEYIARYYASHEDIPKGHYDGEILTKLIRCGECRFWPELIWNEVNLDLNELHTSYARCLHMGPDDYCSKAKRRNNAE